MACKSAVINHQHIGRDFVNCLEGYNRFRHLTGMKFDAGDDGIVQVVAHQYARGRHFIVLVFMPTQGISQPHFIGEPKAGAVGSPKPEALPALGGKGCIKCLVALSEHILKVFG